MASGGELSRIMLTIKSILATYEQLPTMMFDEIDTGVSGEISNRMGDIMQEMSNNMQVFSITHLPQVASKGQHQFKVYKEEHELGTSTLMKKLDPEERVKCWGAKHSLNQLWPMPSNYCNRWILPKETTVLKIEWISLSRNK